MATRAPEVRCPVEYAGLMQRATTPTPPGLPMPAARAAAAPTLDDPSAPAGGAITSSRGGRPSNGYATQNGPGPLGGVPIVVLDFDDTLFPTTHAAKLGWSQMGAMVNEEDRRLMQAIDSELSDLLLQCMAWPAISSLERVGTQCVFVVSNAGLDHLQATLTEFLPMTSNVLSRPSSGSLQNPSLGQQDNEDSRRWIRLVSARDCYADRGSFQWWKCLAFNDIVHRMKASLRLLGMGSVDTQLLSIGDGEWERSAAFWCLQPGPTLKLVKSVQTMNQPCAQRVLHQLRLLRREVAGWCAAPSCLDLRVVEEKKPEARTAASFHSKEVSVGSTSWLDEGVCYPAGVTRTPSSCSMLSESSSASSALSSSLCGRSVHDRSSSADKQIVASPTRSRRSRSAPAASNNTAAGDSVRECFPATDITLTIAKNERGRVEPRDLLIFIICVKAIELLELQRGQLVLRRWDLEGKDCRGQPQQQLRRPECDSEGAAPAGLLKYHGPSRTPAYPDHGERNDSCAGATGSGVPHNGTAAAADVTSKMAQGDERKQSLASWGDEPDFPDMVKALNDLRYLLLPLIRVRADSCLEIVGFKTGLDSAGGAAAAVPDLTLSQGEREKEPPSYRMTYNAVMALSVNRDMLPCLLDDVK
eukprot:GHVU01057603.1.p1 GENE.GHVU01057603.1~~GHVU01057603.1.p1  ORF type:complete len:643 (+),score=70.19 GHVU01057603.1:133-2061(+)